MGDDDGTDSEAEDEQLLRRIIKSSPAGEPIKFLVNDALGSGSGSRENGFRHRENPEKTVRKRKLVVVLRKLSEDEISDICEKLKSRARRQYLGQFSDEDDDDDSSDAEWSATPRKKPRWAKSDVAKEPVCKDCLQPESLLRVFEESDVPETAVDGMDEDIMLLNVFGPSSEALECHEDGGPMIQLEDYVIFDRQFHLVPVDGSCIEKEKPLFFSGRVKSYSDCDGKGTYVHHVGPVDYWWLDRQNGTDAITIGVSTDGAHYYLGCAHEKYAPFMVSVEEKGELVYDVMDVLLEFPNASYAELVEKLEANRPDAEETLSKHAEFIVKHVAMFVDENEEHSELELSPAMCVLEEMANARKKTKRKSGKTSFGKKRRRRKGGETQASKKGVTNSKATTTPLVRSAFEHLFPNQIHGAAEDANIDDLETQTKALRWPPKVEPLRRRVSWTSDRIKRIDGREYYSSCCVDGSLDLRIGDFVTVRVNQVGANSEHPGVVIMKLHEMFAEEKKRFFHGLRFLQSVETILGEALNPMELFASRDCGDFRLSDVLETITVEYDDPPEDWRLAGGKDVGERRTSNYVYKFLVESGECRFQTVRKFNCDVVSPTKVPECENCVWREARDDEVRIVDVSDDDGVLEAQWRGETYRIGDCVLVDPGGMADPLSKRREAPPPVRKLERKDPFEYPELYRKIENAFKPRGYYDDIVAPLRVGMIDAFVSRRGVGSRATSNGLSVLLRMFDRVDEVEDDEKGALYPNGLYWSEEFKSKYVKSLVGKCKITREELLGDTSPVDWRLQQGFILLGDAPEEAEDLCRACAEEAVPKAQPLKCMDLFAGVGGLSIGLHQSGVAETKWAMECNHQAAQSFKVNHKDAVVYEGDINAILHVMMEADADPGKPRKWNGVDLPRRGEVEMITGGPPCQGFSGMNRYNYRENAQFRNSLIAAYVSWIEYFRPRFAVMENVKNFLYYNRSVVLKFLLKSLVEAGYQCAVVVLQAGQFGVPQTRNRAILVACGPGERLPRFPKPLTTFVDGWSGFRIDNVVYPNGNAWTKSNSAPFRCVTVSDAISDLPPVSGRDQKECLAYKCPPRTAFQADVRSGSDVVRDHLCKSLNPINEFRIKKIPMYPGADWRDLPNVEVTLDGVLHRKLEYNFKDESGRRRGVCPCASGRRCDQSESELYRQQKTVIPWCLPHNALRHNQWVGACGRVLKDGYFPTTLTRPDLLGPQGPVIHYAQDRILTVREWARSQGFPDDVRFCGGVLDRYKQIGNAVPPPLSRAIGFEIRVALTATDADSV